MEAREGRREIVGERRKRKTWRQEREGYKIMEKGKM